MIRTQVYLPDPLYKDIKLRAKLANKPAAALIREYIGKGIAEQQKADTSQADEGLMTLANLGIRGGPSDLASNLDNYLYGDGKN